MSSYSPYDSYTAYQQPPDLQPLFSAAAGLVLLLLIISPFYGLNFLTAPLDSLSSLAEMAALGISSLLGKGSLGKVDWAKDADSSEWSEGGGGADGFFAAREKGKMVRRYRETKDGAARAAGGQHYPGLLNAAGNLCFLNATLQSMASLPSLLAYLDSLVTTAIELNVSAPVADTLLDTLEALNTPSTSRPPPLRPVELAHALAASSTSRRRLLASDDQQDAHELWGMIRDAVEEEAGKLLVAQEKAKQAGAGLAEVAKLKDGLGIALSRKKTGRGRNDPWFFLRSQRIKCMECGYVRDTRHEGEELLMLQVPPAAHCSIYDLLAEYTKPDLISDYACRKCAMIATLSKLKAQRDRLAGVSSSSASPACASPLSAPTNPFELPPEPSAQGKAITSSRKERKRKIQRLVERVQEVIDAGDYEKELGDDVKMDRTGTAAAKTVRFARTPDIMLLHLNRSTHYGYSGAVKNSCQVAFPEYLDISPFCDGASPSSADSADAPASRDIYRLSSLVVHYGSHSFGHYVAFRRRPSSPSSDDLPAALDLPDWYRISDETVDPSSIQEALRANPFLLFYERIRDERSASASAAGGLARLDSLVGGAQARVVESWRAIYRAAEKGEPEKEREKDVDGA
ncbi:hypothetical protein JCM10213_004942 [Rhodosporidiobolus nylandii]